MATTIELTPDHKYRVDGTPHRGTNEILDLYFPPSKFYTEEGRIKGSARHKWYEAIAKGVSIKNQPDPKIAGEVIGFGKFWRTMSPKYMFSEIPMFDSILKVCGTPDLVCRMNGRLAVVDYKPKTKAKRTRAQTAAYFHNLRANGVMVEDRYELRLMDGDYRLEKHEEPQDEYRWKAMVAGFFAATFYR